MSWQAMNVRGGLVWGVVIAAFTPTSLAAQTAETLEPQPWQLSKEFALDEDNLEGTVPSKKVRDRNPLEYGYYVQDLLEGAERAHKQGDDYLVVSYYRALVKAVPERAKSWGLLCGAYATVNDHERAARMCATALSLPGVELQDYTRFVRETLLVPGKPKPETVGQLKDVLAHLDKQPDVELTASHLRCEVGVTLNDDRMLEKCTAALTRLEPNSPKTIVYQWSLAMLRGQTEAAGRLVARAKSLKLPAENIERMQALTGASGGRRFIWTGLGAALFLLAAGGALMFARRRRAASLAPAPAAR